MSMVSGHATDDADKAVVIQTWYVRMARGADKSGDGAWNPLIERRSLVSEQHSAGHTTAGSFVLLETQEYTEAPPAWSAKSWRRSLAMLLTSKSKLMHRSVHERHGHGLLMALTCPLQLTLERVAHNRTGPTVGELEFDEFDSITGAYKESWETGRVGPSRRAEQLGNLAVYVLTSTDLTAAQAAVVRSLLAHMKNPKSADGSWTDKLAKFSAPEPRTLEEESKEAASLAELRTLLQWKRDPELWRAKVAGALAAAKASEPAVGRWLEDALRTAPDGIRWRIEGSDLRVIPWFEY